MKYSYVYLMCDSLNRILYVGVSGNLIKRVYEHKNGSGSNFTSKYELTKLVWYEVHEDINEAILREKQIKGGSRKKKIALIEKMNPKWEDLFEDLI